MRYADYQRIKCDRCEKYMVQSQFSFKQLNDARFAIYEKGKGASYKIKCRHCTGPQVVEIECTVCNVVKGLDSFAKIQRTKPDMAVRIWLIGLTSLHNTSLTIDRNATTVWRSSWRRTLSTRRFTRNPPLPSFLWRAPPGTILSTGRTTPPSLPCPKL